MPGNHDERERDGPGDSPPFSAEARTSSAAIVARVAVSAAALREPVCSRCARLSSSIPDRSDRDGLRKRIGIVARESGFVFGHHSSPAVTRNRNPRIIRGRSP
jgi:hypothetical protein